MNDILEKIVSVGFPPNQYYRKITNKKQIVLHHCVSGKGVTGDIDWWIQTPEKVAAHIIIDRWGTPFQTYSSRYFAHHLGVKQKTLRQEGFLDYRTRNLKLNKASIAIEIDSWGPLIKENNFWYPVKWSKWSKKYVARINLKSIPKHKIEFYPNGFREFYAFEKYTNAQIETLKQLLLYWNKKYYIPLTYNEKMFEYNLDAIAGIPGIWSHVSYRRDKSDCHPQLELINMLKSLKI